jgi:hypothetical protein
MPFDGLDLDQGWTMIFEKHLCSKGHNMRVSMMPRVDVKARMSVYCNCDFGLMQLHEFIRQEIHTVNGDAWDFVLSISELTGSMNVSEFKEDGKE